MNTGKFFAIAAAAAVCLTSGAALAEGDAAAGEKSYKTCKMCHPTNGKNGMGPSLVGIVGTEAGMVEGFTKYKGLQGLGVTWDDATLDKFLADPVSVAPATTMKTKVKSAEDRANIIAYLKTLK